jgi:hypothetical protein
MSEESVNPTVRERLTDAKDNALHQIGNIRKNIWNAPGKANKFVNKTLDKIRYSDTPGIRNIPAIFGLKGGKRKTRKTKKSNRKTRKNRK